MIGFTIPGRLGGKGRPKFVRATGRTYTPAKTVSMEAMIRAIASEAMRGRAPLTGAINLNVRVYQNPPASWSKKRQGAASYLTGKPDLDNQLKALGDSCNHIVWNDDAQISDVTFSRRYVRDEPERVEVSVIDLTAAPALQVAA